MDETALYPAYIPRLEELEVLQEVARVRADRTSRVLLLYGPGGIGKTSLVRELPRARGTESRTVWVDPIDVDDPEYWLLSNLESKIASHLDPDNLYFRPYQEYLSRQSSYTRPRVGHETIVSHLGRIKRVFSECYTDFIERTGKTVVIIFDTVEAIRGMYLRTTLTQWMKPLPATLFILAGRPLPGQDDEDDPIRKELRDPHQPMHVKTIRLGRFSEEAALDYLRASRVVRGLTEEEQQKLVLLTRGHPLWLAFTVSYLDDRGVPEEAGARLDELARQLPYDSALDPTGLRLVEAFRRRLVTPYRDADFWHECDKRLAVVRQNVNQQAWQQLMSDRPLPPGVATSDQAWEILLHTPWIRPRANQRFVTLHDAVADELGRRVIPVHDQNKSWRREQWESAARIYAGQITATEPGLARELADLDTTLHMLEEEFRLSPGRPGAALDESAVIEDVARLDARKRELNQLKATRLYYELFGDFGGGCQLFLELFGQAHQEHDVLFQELLALEMQRFLPDGSKPDAAGDVVTGAIGEFRRWLTTQNPQLYMEIGLSIAAYLVENEQAQAAITLIEDLPEQHADLRQRYRLKILLGNAYMRTPSKVRDGLQFFQEALGLAEAIDLSVPERQKLIAEAHKEMGYYYRNAGQWADADHTYRSAHDVIASTLSVRTADEDREELASILTNWAYVKGLRGRFRQGANLVESAINIRQRLGRQRGVGISWSVRGEVYRYECRWHKAWGAYAEAERIFQEEHNWPWLGLVYQEQAICLFQAAQDGVDLTPPKDPIEQAKQLITYALDICRDGAVRGYPSALNRAGRIYGADDPDTGLRHLAEAIDQAQKLSDGWFLFSSLVEYVDMCHQAWLNTRDEGYLARIAEREPDITDVMSQYKFPDLRGRWLLLRGHLDIYEWRKSGRVSLLAEALVNYKEGFDQLALDFAGLPASIIPGEFEIFGSLLRYLPSDIRAEWLTEFRLTWSSTDPGHTVLLAHLEELF